MDWTTPRMGSKGVRLGSILVLLTAGAMAYAGPTYDFTCITNNNAADAATGEAQFLVEVLDPGSGQVEFYFTNTGLNASSITDVYFDDGSLLGIASIAGGSGVSFSQLATPHNLPGGNEAVPPFVTTAGFSADSDPEVQPNGVNPGEWLSITFDLKPDMEYANVLNDLASGALRIGLHAQGFTGDGSESFVNDPPTVPAPGAILLSAMGLGLVGWVRRRGFLGQ